MRHLMPVAIAASVALILPPAVSAQPLLELASDQASTASGMQPSPMRAAAKSGPTTPVVLASEQGLERTGIHAEALIEPEARQRAGVEMQLISPLASATAAP